MIDVAIVDTGGANIASVQHALARLGRAGTLLRDPEKLAEARHVILPGVGAAGDAMQRLQERGWIEALQACDRPVLGICLGLHLLCSRSEEDDRDCLGVFPAEVHQLHSAPGRPVPHMGWNTVQCEPGSRLLQGIPRDSYFYFVHSFAVPVLDCATGVTNYGSAFSSVIEQDNFFATQFHPERSASQGSRVLNNFLSIN